MELCSDPWRALICGALSRLARSETHREVEEQGAEQDCLQQQQARSPDPLRVEEERNSYYEKLLQTALQNIIHINVMWIMLLLLLHLRLILWLGLIIRLKVSYNKMMNKNWIDFFNIMYLAQQSPSTFHLNMIYMVALLSQKMWLTRLRRCR